MRKWNAFLSAGILLLFFIHAVTGAFQLAGIYPGGSKLLSVLAMIMVIFMAFHALIGIILTGKTLRALKKAGVSYFRENRLFWARRISGFAVMVLVFFHIALFAVSGEEVFRLRFFGEADLVIQLLFLLAVALHVISNVKPLLISFGIRSLKDFCADMLIILSAILILAGAGFFVYYLRWNAVL